MKNVNLLHQTEGIILCGFVSITHLFLNTEVMGSFCSFKTVFYCSFIIKMFLINFVLGVEYIITSSSTVALVCQCVSMKVRESK